MRQPTQNNRTPYHDPVVFSWQALWEQYDQRLWLETLWMLAVNAVTGYVFLKWDFTWPQEVSKAQRFMW